MAKKRVISTAFWEDDKVVDEFSPEDKYFMLYLLTNPHTTQLGIYQISKKIMSFELGYSKEAVDTLMDRFENKYQIIKYNPESKEIAIKNYLKHSIIKGGKPIEDLLTKEINQVKDRKLIDYVFNSLSMNQNLNETLLNIINVYVLEKEDDIDNDYVNDNDNDVSLDDSYDDSYDDSLTPVVKLPLVDKTEFIITQKMIDDWQSVYKAIDVKYECERMRLWLEANPLNKKTRTGTPRFINTWLSKNQDRAPKVKKETKVQKNETIIKETEKKEDPFAEEFNYE